MDRPEVAANIAEVRREEMDACARDPRRRARTGSASSTPGLPEGDPLPPLPEGCFALRAAGGGRPSRWSRLIREFRPHVMTTYDENGGYPHPDHIMCHKVSVAAFEAAGDPDRYPDAGEPWQPLKLYYHHGFNKQRSSARCTRRCSRAASSRRTTSGCAKWEATARASGTHHAGAVRRLLRGPRPGAARARHPDRPDGPFVRHARTRSSARPGRPRTTSWSRSLVDTDAAGGRPVRRRP